MNVGRGREKFEALNAELEAALAIVRRCGKMTQFDKLLDHGETKNQLVQLRENIFNNSREVGYCVPFCMRSCSSTGVSEVFVGHLYNLTSTKNISRANNENHCTQIYFPIQFCHDLLIFGVTSTHSENGWSTKTSS